MKKQLTLEKTVTVFITKYWETCGILEALCTTVDKYPEMIRIGTGLGGLYLHKPDWHLTLEEARDHVMILKARKVIAIQKKLQKVEAIDPYVMQPTQWGEEGLK